MTDNTMSLRGLLEKTTDTDFLREMIGFAARPSTGTPKAAPAAVIAASGQR
jgi:hypothetical protein